jgi:hypothetical protein
MMIVYLFEMTDSTVEKHLIWLGVQVSAKNHRRNSEKGVWRAAGPPDTQKSPLRLSQKTLGG